MEEEVKEETIEEMEEATEVKEEPKKSFNLELAPTYLALASIVLTFLKVFFSIIITGVALQVIYIICFTLATLSAVGAVVAILFKKNKLAFNPDFILATLAILISFI